MSKYLDPVPVDVVLKHEDFIKAGFSKIDNDPEYLYELSLVEDSEIEEHGLDRDEVATLLFNASVCKFQLRVDSVSPVITINVGGAKEARDWVAHVEQIGYDF